METFATRESALRVMIQKATLWEMLPGSATDYCCLGTFPLTLGEVVVFFFLVNFNSAGNVSQWVGVNAPQYPRYDGDIKYLFNLNWTLNLLL